MSLTTGFSVPTLDTLIDRISGDLNASLSGIDAYVEGTDEWILARVLAGAAKGLYGYQGKILSETFVQTASDTNLEEIGSVWGVTRNAATAATVTIEVTASGAVTIPAGTLLTRSDGLFEYETDSVLTFVGAGTDTVDVTATSTGSDSSLDVGATLTFASTIPSVTAATTVTAVVADGSDIETLSAYRARILERIQSTPQGGAESDWEGWAEDVDGVERAWITSPTPGYVRCVYEGTPSTGTVETYLSDDSRQPVGSSLQVVKGTEYGVAADVTVVLEDGYVLADVETSIEAQIEALCTREGAPSTTIYNSQLRTAIGNASGVDYYVLNDLILGGVSAGATSDATSTATSFHALDSGNMNVVE